MSEDLADTWGPLAVDEPVTLMRLRLLRIAADTSPRLTGGVRAEDVIARARAFEIYVASPPLGSAQASSPADLGTGAPATAPDTGPADLRRDEGPKSAGSAQASV